MAIADNKAVIGTHHYDRGAAYVFHAVGGHWVEQAKLTPTSNGENRVFGSAVDIWETTALVGAYRACDSSSCAGAAMIYGVGGVDCNENGVFDLCELQDSASGSDCNDNLIPDECEPDCNATGLPDECDPITFGDFDGSGKVDLYDHHAFAECMGGPGGGASPGDLVCRNACLLGFDGDADGDVDLKDAAGFARLFSP